MNVTRLRKIILSVLARAVLALFIIFLDICSFHASKLLREQNCHQIHKVGFHSTLVRQDKSVVADHENQDGLSSQICWTYHPGIHRYYSKSGLTYMGPCSNLG